MPKVSVGNIEISYTSEGAGDPVLLVHAFPLNSRMWEPQIEALGERWRFVAPDLKGFGASSAPDDPQSYTMDSYADELAGVLDALGLAKVVLVGLSMGGYISFAFLRRHSERVSALVLADTKAEADPPEGIAKRTGQQQIVGEQGTGPLIEQLPGALLGEATLAKKPDVVAKVKELMDNPAAGWIGALEAMKNRPDSTPDLTRIKVPTLVIVGENDGVTPVDAARKIHEHVGGSRLVVLPEAGHLSSLEAPEAFNGATAEFLSQL
jgi:3-oxoadipate enol-lactonase